MPFDSEGNFTRIHNWEDDRVNDIEIVTDHHDEEDDNLAGGLSECFLKDGRAAMRGNLDMGNFKIKNLDKGVSETDGVNKKQFEDGVSELRSTILSLLDENIEIGDIKASALAQDHHNWLLCDGREVDREAYSDLYEAIGVTFGAGNEITTFNLPDCRGVFLRGVDGSRGFDEDRVLGTYQDDQVGKHLHLVGYTGSTNTDLTNALTLCGNESGQWYGSRMSGTSAAANGGRSSGVYTVGEEDAIKLIEGETRVKNLAVNYFIKAKKNQASK